jgi:hypothetical protein
MGLTSPNSYSRDSRFEQSLKKGAERGVRNVRTERGIAEKEIKKRGKKVLEAHSGEGAVFQQFSFYFHILKSSISYIKDEFLLENNSRVSGNYGKVRMAINVKGIVNSIKHAKFGPHLQSVATADTGMRTDAEMYIHLSLLKFNCSVTASA